MRSGPRRASSDSRGGSHRWVLAGLLIGTLGCVSESVTPLRPTGEAEVPIMDFGAMSAIEPLPPGWRHRRFWWHPPMEMSLVDHRGVSAIRLATSDSASMLLRAVDVPITEYPQLHWRWLVERGLRIPSDETTAAGDDHPARLFIRLAAAGGVTRAFEIIWSNGALARGDYKFVHEFPHYVANGGVEQEGRWHAESVNLAQIFRRLWGDPGTARVIEVGLFCDTDDTGDRSVAYFADVRMVRRGA